MRLKLLSENHLARRGVWRRLSYARPTAIALIALICVGSPARGADTAPGLFESHEPLTVTIEAPFREIAADSADEYRNSVLRLDGAEIPLRIRARGKYRRRPSVCQFPPLRLNFAKDTVANTVFAGQDKLKLVTHCRGAAAFEQYLLREYVAYRLYNHITERSFRVRLLEVTYVDTVAGGRMTRPAFLIESAKQMAQRNDAKLVRVKEIPRGALEAEATNLYEVFQYMIGNTDWSNTSGPDGDLCCHNTELISNKPNLYIPVPYDFDASGFVDPPHAIPGERLGISHVTVRLYRGFCRPEHVVSASAGQFIAQREALLASVRGQAGLSRRTVSTLTRYLDRFFRTISDSKKRDRAIDGNCR